MHGFQRMEDKMDKQVFVLPELVSALSKDTNTSQALCETFVKELFSLFADKLVNGENVSFKGIGVFSIKGNEISFIPEDSFSQTVNSAFECFSPIILADGYNPESDETDDFNCQRDSLKSEIEMPTEKSESEDESKETDDLLPVITKPILVDESVNDMNEESRIDGNNAQNENESDSCVDSDNALIVGENKRCRFGYWWGVVSGGIVGGLIASLAFLIVGKHDINKAVNKETITIIDTIYPEDIVKDDDSKSIVTVNSENVDNNSEKGSQTFVVTKTAYLSNISRKFYGSYVFWVYIYLENKDIIKDPDNLPVGETITIPSPEKYGIDKDNPESVRRAELKALEIKSNK